MNKLILFSLAISLMILASCGSDNGSTHCVDPKTISVGPNSFELVPVDVSERPECEEELSFTPNTSIYKQGANRIIETNSIPAHKVGLSGSGSEALNPNAIKEVNSTYSVPLEPTMANELTPVLDPNSGPKLRVLSIIKWMHLLS